MLREITNFNSLLDSLFQDFGGLSHDLSLKSGFNVEIKENEKGYSVVAELAGVNKEDISVSINENVLIISAEKKSNIQKEEGDKVYSEVYKGKIQRKLRLRNIDSKNVEAKFENGLLTLELKKVNNQSDKNIPIK